jgi:hypothetical protein
MSSSSSSQEPQQGKQQKPDILSTEVLNADEAKFIEIKKLNYVDQTGRKRVWEVAQRKTRNESGVDGQSPSYQSTCRAREGRQGVSERTHWS